MDYNTLHDFVNHPGFELYNMILNAQIEDFKAKLEGVNLINPITKAKYTEVEYEVMRWMINNLREMQDAPLIELNKQIYEVEQDQQEIIENEIEATKSKMEKVIKKKVKKVKKSKEDIIAKRG